jgi:peptidoglycan/LPS O-acetylase OafA/YrhL
MINPSNRHSGIKYRPDIDGLRAVAILSVLAFHLSPSGVSGGFVGVDVFFVISGYLISAIVFSEIASGRFSVVGFYERRVRRIFPALFAMLIVVTAVISLFLLPTELTDYARSVIAATTSSSNFYFWQHSGYFDSPTSNPLLHTWSLAVEEQFYISFPIFLVVTRRFFSQWLKHAVVIFLFVSFAASVITLHYDATSAFYLPYSRAWELLIGTVISLGFFPKLRSAASRNATTVLGIALIGYSVMRFTSQTPFPGVAAAIPCLGSALIIGAGESGSTLVGKILSWRPVVFIGLISYSFYLWHWPVIVLNGLGLSVNLTGIVPNKLAFLLLSQTGNKVMELLISFVLAVLSWRFVERPFRGYPRRLERRSLFALSGAVVALLLVSSGAIIHASGFPSRFPPRAVRVASFLAPPGASTLGQLGSCVITDKNESSVFDDSSCLQGDAGKGTYLLLGDSHAGSLWHGLKASLPGSNVELAGVWGCRPSVQPEGSPLCRRMSEYIFQRYLPSRPIEGLLLEARWYSKDLNRAGEVAEWAKTHGVTVVVFGPVAEYDAPLPRLLAYSIAWGKPDLARQHRLAYSPVMDSQMRDLAESKWHVPYVSLYQATCERDHCIEYADEQNAVPLLNDTDHLSDDGSRILVDRLLHLGDLNCLNDELSSK